MPRRLTGRAVDTGGVQTPQRTLFLLLCGGTWAGAVTAMAYLLRGGGIGVADGVLLACFAFAIPMVITGFWNAALGTAILALTRAPVSRVASFADAPAATWDGRLAVVMPVRNEDAATAVATLRRLLGDLDARGLSGACEVHLLSDSDDPDALAAEAAAVAAWRAADPAPQRIGYRHRAEPVGYKAGNIREFVERAGDRFGYMLVLDADSAMTAPAVDRLMRVMAARPAIGILQPLAVGAPASSIFARAMQFGMRHGMLVHSVGAAWWQGDAGPYWGHNAVIRMRPFRDACDLPRLPGRSPLAGAILSHDQVEAALMRAHGHSVRLLPIEDGSFEEMPPTMFDFIKRELRWCLGNLQYLKLLTRPGFRAMGRLQLAMAVLMYTAAPAWLLFLVIGFAAAVAAPGGLDAAGYQARAVGIGLFAGMLGITFAPKVLGTAHALLDGARRRAFGGGRRVLAGALSEVIISVLTAPTLMLAISLFAAGLPFGRRVSWTAQARTARHVPFSAAVRRLWPQTAAGTAGSAILAVGAPAVLPWAAPVLVPLIAAPGIAWATAHPVPSALARRAGLWATPEERHAPHDPIPPGQPGQGDAVPSGAAASGLVSRDR